MISKLTLTMVQVATITSGLKLEQSEPVVELYQHTNCN